MVEVKYTHDAQLVRRFDDVLVIYQGIIIKTYHKRDRDKAKSYARGWNMLDRDKGRYTG